MATASAPPSVPISAVVEEEVAEDESTETADATATESAVVEETEAGGDEEAGDEEAADSGSRYPTKGRGTMGVRDISTTTRNGPVVAIARVTDEDELLMMTARGKIQRIRASDISVIGRNTQGVRIMSLDEDDKLVAVVPVPLEEADEGPIAATPPDAAPPTAVPPAATATDPTTPPSEDPVP